MKLKLIGFGLFCLIVAGLNWWLSFPTSMEMDAALSQLRGNPSTETMLWAHLRDNTVLLVNCLCLLVGTVLFMPNIINLVDKTYNYLTEKLS